jgi:hypothetical protein
MFHKHFVIYQMQILIIVFSSQNYELDGHNLELKMSNKSKQS